MSSDNFHAEVRSRGREHFAAAVRLAWSNAPGGKATHFVCGIPKISCPECHGGFKTGWKDKVSFDYPCPECRGSNERLARVAMVLLWHEDSVRLVKATALPFPLTCEPAIDFLWAWLETCEYAPEPDQDGSNEKGFIVTTGDFWGHVEDSHYAFVGVYPDWQMYGK